MANNTSAFRVTELDFMTIRENLKEYLRSQNELVDFDFEGSGMAIILDLLAYNTHYMAMNLNLVGNEMFIDTAQIRASLVSHAKLANYVPNSRNASTAKVNILVTPGGSESNTTPFITLDKYSRFLSEPIDGITYNFLTVNANTAPLVNGSFLFSNVVIRQGEHQTTTFLVEPTNTKRRFTIDTANVDISTLEVSVQESDSNTTLTTFSKANDITILTGNSDVYFVEENVTSEGNYVIYFGDGIIGRSLSNGNIVITDYIVTRGDASNKAGGFTSISDIDGYSSNVIVTTLETGYGGSERESTESIRHKAPIYRTTQGRAVVDSDYELFLLKDYPNIESVSVWGGDVNIPPVYGKVFISLKPVNNYVISVEEKERIKEFVIKNRSVLGIFPEIVDPEYTYLLIRTKVYFDKDSTNLTSDDIKMIVRQAILDYRDNEIKGFNSTFRESKLQKYINESHNSITGCDIEVYLQKRITPKLNVNQNIVINYNTQLYKAGSLNKLFSFPEIVVVDNDGIQRRVLIEEVPDSFTGLDRITITSTGDNYTSNPTVTITGDGLGALAEPVIVNQKLNSINITNRGINYSRAIVNITGGGGSGASAVAELQARNGTLRAFYYRNTGEKVIVNSNIGSIDYEAGLITLSGIEPREIIDNTLYSKNVLTINIQPNEDTVKTMRNSIIDIDENDTSSIIIDVVEE